MSPNLNFYIFTWDLGGCVMENPCKTSDHTWKAAHTWKKMDTVYTQMERRDYIQVQHAPLQTFCRLQLAYKKNDFPKKSIGEGWDLILHEFEGSNTFKIDNMVPSLKESTFYI